VKPVIETLKRRGMPNYFGEQRFGRRGDNDKLGALLVRGDDAGLLAQLLGSGEPPGGMERAVQARLAKTGNPTAAVKSIDEKIRKLWVSALQSRLFNDVLARRVDSIDVLRDGDLAYKHENGACFRVESASAEQPRCDAFEISPTGPLLGCRMSVPGGAPLEAEHEVFATAGLSAADFRSARLGKVRGARRPLRVRPESVELAAGVDDHGAHVTVAFTLPAGSFATILLRELMKADNITCSEPPPR
jgi:tRNA pseudouridine13 synthase